MAGIALIYTALAAFGLLLIARLWPIWILSAGGCGVFTMWVGEKFKVVPSTKDLNRNLAPVSLSLFDQPTSDSYPVASVDTEFDQRHSHSDQGARAGAEGERANPRTWEVGDDANGDDVLELRLTMEESLVGAQKIVSVSGKELRLNVPAGVETGTRLPGQGPTTAKSGRPGDLYVVILVHSHPLYQRRDNDLYWTVRVTDLMLRKG